MDQAAPTFDALVGGLREMFFSAAREDGYDGGNSELSCFFDGPFHAIEFEDGEKKRDGQCGFGVEFAQEIEAHLCGVYRIND
jgi:hypothetical protein